MTLNHRIVNICMCRLYPQKCNTCLKRNTYQNRVYQRCSEDSVKITTFKRLNEYLQYLSAVIEAEKR